MCRMCSASVCISTVSCFVQGLMTNGGSVSTVFSECVSFNCLVFGARTHDIQYTIPWGLYGGPVRRTSIRRGLIIPLYDIQDIQDLRHTIYNTVGTERWTCTMYVNTAGFNHSPLRYTRHTRPQTYNIQY